tara:strand:- start:51 stop:326 length:276 start_codon:yes stop_codon:yes gene_type:complete
MEKRKRISGYKQHINDPFVSVSIYHELNNAEKEKIVSEECSKHLAAFTIQKQRRLCRYDPKYKMCSVVLNHNIDMVYDEYKKDKPEKYNIE